jgi:hypothetical protein
MNYINLNHHILHDEIPADYSHYVDHVFDIGDVDRDELLNENIGDYIEEMKLLL